MAYLATTLRPGLLVGLSTSITGNVKYTKEVLKADTLDETGELTAEWKTERKVKNAKEQEEATKVRSRIRTIVSAPCSRSSFGLLCPEGAKADLDKAIAEAQKLAADFNKSATTTRLHVSILSGKIDPNEVSAIKAINSEITQLIDGMKAGLDKLDVKAVREAANQAKQLSQMLSQTAQAQVQIAIEAVRKSARKIAAAGEVGAIEIDNQTLAILRETRTSFLDLDEAKDIAAPAAIARSVDFETVEAPKEAVKAAGSTYGKELMFL
jgi:hypothetical protein